MRVHATKIDNSHFNSKINLRKMAIKELNGDAKVLDLFAGNNKLWSSFNLVKYYGVEKEHNKGKNLNADNMLVIKALDLSKFNVIDLDAYGIPANQIYELYQNPTLQKGTVIIYTAITNSMAALNRQILKMFHLKEIYHKTKSCLMPYSLDMFYGMLYSLGVKKVIEYNVKQKYDKHYGYFIV